MERNGFDGSKLPTKNAEEKWIINPRWFRHLAPPQLLPYHATFDYLYREWLGREIGWQRDTGRSFSVQPMQIVEAILHGSKLQVPIGDPIPTIEMLVEVHPNGSRVAKVLPRWLQRRVTEEDIRRTERSHRRSNEPLPGFITSFPTLIMEASQWDSGARSVFIAPAHFLIKPRLGLPIAGPKPYTVYCHTFGNAENEGAPNYFYYGVTQRSWQERWTEHVRAINGGSQLKFHKVFREEIARSGVSFIGHDVVHIAENIDELYGWEEDLVSAAWGDPMLLNMIPGGKAGIAYMAKHGMLRDSAPLRPHLRDKILEEWLTKHSRSGLPAPWVAERWQNPEWASSFVCSGVGRLTEEQVRYIRTLGAKGLSPEEICELASARTLDQVRNVLSGKTYGRVS